MKRVTLQQLSDLVLVDILAAMPMCAAVRLAQLGCQRLQAISCRPWVLRRMADVNFSAVVKAYQAAGRIRDVFCGGAVLRRLYGRVEALPSEMRPTLLREPIINIMSKIPGHIHCNRLSIELVKNLLEFPSNVRRKIKYITGTFDRLLAKDVARFPNLVVFSSKDKALDADVVIYDLEYRPALLNGRHVVELLRAICGPSVASEAELDRVRTGPTRRVFNTWPELGLQGTQWVPGE